MEKYFGWLFNFELGRKLLVPKVLTYFFKEYKLMPYPCSGENLISNLVTDYIQKRRGEPGLFSFEYNLLPKLTSIFYHYTDQVVFGNSRTSFWKLGANT